MMVLFYMSALFALVSVLASGVVRFHSIEDYQWDEQEVRNLAGSGVEMAIWRLSLEIPSTAEFGFELGPGSVHVGMHKESSSPLTYSVESTARLTYASPKAPARKVRALVEKRGDGFGIVAWTTEGVLLPLGGETGE